MVGQAVYAVAVLSNHGFLSSGSTYDGELSFTYASVEMSSITWAGYDEAVICKDPTTLASSSGGAFIETSRSSDVQESSSDPCSP